MPSLDERVAVIEHRLDELDALIHSGHGVPWRKSLRGRLHEVEQVIRAADNLRDAAREMRRAQTRRWSTGKQVALVVCAIATALAPYVVLVAHGR